MYTIKEIMKITKGKLVQGDQDALIEHINFDSRKLLKNALFIALTKGERDGHIFLPAAKEGGAVAALISHLDGVDLDELNGVTLVLVEDTEIALQELAIAYRDRINIPIVVVTGSNGKTSTKDMIAHMLSGKKKVYKTEGNFNNHLGAPLSLLHIEAEHEVAVLELGMNHAGELDFLARMVQPTISVITNIGEAHIEFLGSKENIAKAKGEILDHTDTQGFIILNGDDPLVCSQANRYPGQTYYYSTSIQADIYATQIGHTLQGTTFQLFIEGKHVDCFIPMFGEHNVSNLLPACYIAYKLGLSLEEIKYQMLSMEISKMRFEILEGPNHSTLINDAYNASPSSMKAAINTFLHIYPQKKKILVLGDMFELGENSVSMHEEVGSYIQQKRLKTNQSFEVFTLGKDSASISKLTEGQHLEGLEEAIAALKPYMQEDYILLFKASRGMKFELLIQRLIR